MTMWLPAEWHPNRAVWLAWPSHAEEWRNDLASPRRTVAALIRAIAGPGGERVRLLVMDQAGRDSALSHLSGVPVELHEIPFGDIWLRDTGPVFVSPDGNSLEAACFQWNGWGGKYLFEHDPELAERIARAVDARVRRHDYVLEGGAIDTDGRGTALTTRQCLLADNRNPGRVTEADVSRRLGDALGIRHTIWLDRGLANDHTDGHVDNLARFVAPGKVVCMRASGPDDPNRDVFDSVVERLKGARDARGERLEVVEIPSPGRVLGPPGDTLMAASYVNFYIGNATVVVPTYGSHNDDIAVASIAALFPERRTVAVDARGVIGGGGAFHCITRQQPALPRQPRKAHAP